MEIAPTGQNLGANQAAQQSGAITSATDGMGRDQFLKLLTTQIQNQDPLEPLQNHEFVAQLAQFSALEQQIMTNETLAQLQMSQMSLSNGQLTGMIGKEVVARGDSVYVANGTAQPVGVLLPSAASSIEVTITDENGNAVATFQRDRLPAGYQEIAWDGVGADGKLLPNGRYNVAIAAKDSTGNPLTIDPMTRGVVDAITFENGYPELIIGNARVVPGDVLSIHEGAAPGPVPTPTPALPQKLAKPTEVSLPQHADNDRDDDNDRAPPPDEFDPEAFFADDFSDRLEPPPWLLAPTE